MTNYPEINGYEPGHPWFYVLGGSPLPPSVICSHVKTSGYQGYRTDIAEADTREEPRRSRELRSIRQSVLAEFWDDISRYRQVVRHLHHHRRDAATCPEHPNCADVHVSVSLKHSHLYNDFAHLIRLDELLAQQPDLFGSIL